MAQPKEKITAQISARRDYQGPAFLKQGFRPFFLASGVWAALAMLVWLVELSTNINLPLFSYMPAVVWHMHEMLYGFTAAAIAGFLMTAIPNWTGRLPVRGKPLAWLALLWLAGRLAMLMGNILPPALLPAAALVDSLFLVVLALLMGREVIAGKNWRNLKVIAVVALLALSHIAFHLAALDILDFLSVVSVAFAAILLVVLLLNIIGGRIVPSFTRNWLAKRGAPLPAPRDHIDQAGDVAVTLAALMLLALPDFILTALISLIAAALQLFRLTRWRGIHTSSEPIVLVLHVGFLWMVIGFALAGLAIVTEDVPQVAATHAFTAGLIGTMILAVMSRATRGHSGVAIIADSATIGVYVLVSVAALVRVASVIAGFSEIGYLISGLCWIGAFALFTYSHLPMFLGRPG